MPENKPKPSPSMLKKLLGGALTAASYTPAGQVLKAGRDVISRASLNRMAQNLEPYSYSNYGTGQSAFQRGVNAIIKNQPEEARTETERYIETGAGMKPMPDFRERVDLLQMLANKPQKYGTIEKSEYTPSVGAEKGSQYYKSKGLEEAIIEKLGLAGKDVKFQKDILDVITPQAIYNEKKKRPMIEKSGVVAEVPGLGAATYGVGRDKKGVYLSYADTWDLDPSSGIYAEDEEAGGMTTLEGLKNLAASGFKKAATSVINATATPPKVYGRIYFDPKTGKRIK
jgi:hypothetical protein